MRSIIFTIFVFSLGANQLFAESETRNLGSFSKLSASTGVNVELIQSDKEEVIVTIENTSTSAVTTENMNGTLRIGMNPSFSKDIAVLVTVFYKELRSVDVITGAKVTSKNPIIANQLRLRATLGGHLEVEAEASNLKLVSNQGSTLIISGVCDTLFAKATIGGKIESLNLMSEKAVVNCSTGGTASIRAKNKLDVNATASTVWYAGNAKRTVKTSLGGKVLPVETDPGYTYVKKQQ